MFSTIFIFIVRRLSDVPGSIKTEEIARGSSTYLAKKVEEIIKTTQNRI